MTQSIKNKKQKIPSVRTALIDRGGFGLFQFEINKYPRPINRDAKEFTEKMILQMDEYIQEKYKDNPADALAFLDSLLYDLGGMIAEVCEARGDTYNSAEIPREFYDNRESYEQQDLGIDWYYLFDHFARRKDKDDNVMWVSNPYGISSGFLKEAIAWCDRKGLKFYITAASNYFPFHSIQIQFKKVELPQKNTPS